MKKYLSELVGTMVLVLMGTGTAVIAGAHVGNVGIALAFGLSVLGMVYVIGPISGGHMNPAITFGVWMSKRMSSKDAFMYIVFQIIGALLATSILAVITGQTETLGQNQSTSYPLVSVFIAEVVATFIFVLVVLGSTSKIAPLGFAGIAIGLTLTLDHLMLIPIDGTSVNPARSIAPALFTGGLALHQLWIFIVAPLVGGAIAAFVWKAISPEKVEHIE